MQWTNYGLAYGIHGLAALFHEWLPGHQIINCSLQQFICFQCGAPQFWLDKAQKSCSLIGCLLKMQNICIAMQCFNIYQQFSSVWECHFETKWIIYKFQSFTFVHQNIQLLHLRGSLLFCFCLGLSLWNQVDHIYTINIQV